MKKMLPVFEVPEILTIDGNPFNGEFSNSDPKAAGGKGCASLDFHAE